MHRPGCFVNTHNRRQVLANADEQGARTGMHPQHRPQPRYDEPNAGKYRGQTLGQRLSIIRSGAVHDPDIAYVYGALGELEQSLYSFGARASPPHRVELDRKSVV